MPAKQMPKKKFERPSIDLTPHGKEWQTANVEDLNAGDNVRDHGILANVYPRGTEDIQLAFSDGRSQWFKRGTSVYAFTAKRES